MRESECGDEQEQEVLLTSNKTVYARACPSSGQTTDVLVRQDIGLANVSSLVIDERHIMSVTLL